MRIGVLLNKFRNLSNWELRILERIIDHPKLELYVFHQHNNLDFQDSYTFSNAFFRWYSGKPTLGTLILGLHELIEKKIFFKEALTVNKNRILSHLNSRNTLMVRPVTRENLVTFGSDDIAKIRELDIDLMVKLSEQSISEEIINLSKFGVWSLELLNRSKNRSGPVGFWETLFNEATVECSLVSITKDHRQVLVIDQAYFYRHWSYVHTKNIVLEASVSVIFKNIRKLKRRGKHIHTTTKYSNPHFKSPNTLSALKYVGLFYVCILNKIISRGNTKFFGSRYVCWNLFLGKGDFLNASLTTLNPVELPKTEFWADPFLFKYKDIIYVFFENFCYKANRGKISCGKVVNDQIEEVVDVLVKDYHLSFPFIFEEDGEIYMIPETCENNRLEIYRCTDFPMQWELHSTAFEGEMVADAVIYTDKENVKWLFINKGKVSYKTLQNELYIYKIDSINLKTITPHKQNPVIIDSRVARNAGAIFESNNQLYRPSQRNVEGIYGRALNINKIEKLTIDEYIESIERIVKPNFRKGLMATHHLHQIDGLFVMDAAYKRK